MVQAVEPKRVRRRSVVQEPPARGPWGDLIISIAAIADEFPAWGTQPAVRDRKLREFWPTEPIVASALTSMAAKYAAFGWKIQGPKRTAQIVQRILHNVDFGEGWTNFILKIAIDLFSQDNGAFIEIERTRNDPDAPVIGLNHLDSSRCYRTGRREEPVIYYDLNGIHHTLRWYHVITLSEMPSPIEIARGRQYCAVTRLLKAAQIMRDIEQYKREKISGRFNRAIHIVGGVARRTLDEALLAQSEQASNEGLTRYIQPLIVAALDPNASVTKQTIEMASLPDGFDEEVAMRWYINQLALAFLTDYQDFAPLPAGNLGTSQQSQILHTKSRGKGPALFMAMIENKFNFHGVLPSNCRFTFGEKDTEQDSIYLDLRVKRGQDRAARIASGEIDAKIARQIAQDDGDLLEEYLQDLNERNIVPETQVTSGANPLEADDKVPAISGSNPL